MKAFDFLSAVCELGNVRGFASLRHDPEDGRDLITKIKDTPVACIQTENQFIFIYEME